MTTSRVPVRMTASEGTSTEAVDFAPANATVAYMPGLSAPPGFVSTIRARTVRVAALTSGSNACTVPRNTRSGAVAARTSTGTPATTSPACASGTSAITQTLARPAMRTRLVPGITAMPSRAPISQTMPDTGEVTVTRPELLAIRN